MICKMVKWLISVATWVTGEQRMSVWNFPIAVELPSTPDRDLLKSPTRICFHSHNLHSNSSTMKDLVKELKHGRYLLCISELDQKTDWLYYCFHPQEDQQQLVDYRSQLSPFLKSISKALHYELKNKSSCSEGLGHLCDEILREAQSLSSACRPEFPQTQMTALQMEHDLLRQNMK